MQENKHGEQSSENSKAKSESNDILQNIPLQYIVEITSGDVEEKFKEVPALSEFLTPFFLRWVFSTGNLNCARSD